MKNEKNAFSCTPSLAIRCAVLMSISLLFPLVVGVLIDAQLTAALAHEERTQAGLPVLTQLVLRHIHTPYRANVTRLLVSIWLIMVVRVLWKASRVETWKAYGVSFLYEYLCFAGSLFVATALLLVSAVMPFAPGYPLSWTPESTRLTCGNQSWISLVFWALVLANVILLGRAVVLGRRSASANRSYQREGARNTSIETTP